MDSKQIKSAVSDLDKAKDDSSVLDILKALDKGVVATEALLRETKVGVAVNKFRSSKNQEIVDMVKKMIKNWKDEVKKSKHKKQDEKPKASASPAAAAASSPATATTTGSKKVYNGPRNVATDKVTYSIYDDKTRNGSLMALYNGLAKDNTTMSADAIFDICKEIEKSVYNLAEHTINDTYRAKLRTLVMNIKSSNNPDLRVKILEGKVLPHRLARMSPEEMVSESVKKEIEEIEKANLFKAKSAVEKRAITDSFICGKCKQRKVTYYQMQTRSADEPLTTFCTCVNCGNHWTFS